MYKVTTTTEVNATVRTHSADTFKQMTAIVRQAEKEAVYSSIVVDESFEWGAFEYLRKDFTPEHNHNQRLLNRRLADEKRIYKKVVESAIRFGCLVSVYDGEETTVKRSKAKPVILHAGQSTDMDKLTFRDARTNELIGSVLFIYGNLGSEVINDHTDNERMHDILAVALAYADKLAKAGR